MKKLSKSSKIILIFLALSVLFAMWVMSTIGVSATSPAKQTSQDKVKTITFKIPKIQFDLSKIIEMVNQVKAQEMAASNATTPAPTKTYVKPINSTTAPKPAAAQPVSQVSSPQQSAINNQEAVKQGAVDIYAGSTCPYYENDQGPQGCVAPSNLPTN